MQLGDFMNLGVLNQAKDAAISQVLILIINNKISGAGKVAECKYESKNKRLFLSILFNEEPSAINISVEGIGFQKEDPEIYIAYETLTISKYWMNKLYHEIVEPEILGGKSLEVPEKYAEKLRLVL